LKKIVKEITYDNLIFVEKLHYFKYNNFKLLDENIQLLMKTDINLLEKHYSGKAQITSKFCSDRNKFKKLEALRDNKCKKLEVIRNNKSSASHAVSGKLSSGLCPDDVCKAAGAFGDV
jgi:hypothetical protein